MTKKQRLGLVFIIASISVLYHQEASVVIASLGIIFLFLGAIMLVSDG